MKKPPHRQRGCGGCCAGPRRGVLEATGALRFDGARHACAVGRVGLRAVRDVLVNNVLGHPGNVACRVLAEQLLLVGCHQAEQVAQLGEVVVVVGAVVPAVGGAVQGQRGAA